MSERYVYQIEIIQGTDYSQSFVYRDPCTELPNDLTNFTADFKVKINGNGTYDGQSNPDTVLELNTTNIGGITLGGTNGLITITITNDLVEAVTWNRGVYNLILIDPNGKKIPFLSGFVTIVPSVD